jgi:dCTP deaminase
MTVLSAQSIRNYVYIYPWSERTVHPCGMSYGLSASGYDLRIKDNIYLAPMAFALVTTLEEIAIPTIVQGILLDKSTFARRGLSCFNTKFEPGWQGYPTVELINLGRMGIKIEAGEPLCQMEFHLLDAHTEMPYEGKYQNQPQKPIEAIYEKAKLPNAEDW